MAISDAQYQEWLESDTVDRTLLVEAKYYDGTEKTEYMSTRGHITKPADTPSNQEYEDVVQAFPVFRRAMSEAFTGRTQQSFGDIEIVNPDGSKDSWLDRSWNGRDVILKFGDPSWDYADFRTIMSGASAELTTKSINVLVLKIRDKGVFLEKQVQEALFSSGPSLDKPIPVCYGEVYKIAPVLEDGATHKYKMNDGEISAITAVYDKGVAVGTTDTLSTASFTLGAQPAGQVTADILGAVIASIDDDPATTNLTTRSEESDHADWTKTRSSIAADSVDSPDGTTNADSLIEDATASNTHFINQAVTVTNATVYTQSVFAKAGTRTQIWAGDDSANSATVGVWFDLTTGTVGTQRAGWTGVIEDYGFGWYRCSVTGTSTSTTWEQDVALADADASISYNGDNASLVYLWGHQLEQQTVVTAYELTVGASSARTLTAYRDDIASIVYDIIKNRSDLTASDIDVISFQAFKLRHPQKVGLYIDGKDKFVPTLDKLLNSIGGFWGFSREGKLGLGQLIDPSEGVSVLTLVSDDIIQGGMSIKKRQLPRYKVTLGYQPYDEVQTAGELAGSVSEDTVADLIEPFRLTISEDTGVLTTHLLAHESQVLPTQLADSTEADAEALRRRNLRDQLRSIYLIDNFSTPFSVELGDVITIDHDRFGFDGGVKATVVGYSESVTPPRIQLEAWR